MAALPTSRVATAGSLVPRAQAVPPVRGRPEPREVAKRREGRVTLPPAACPVGVGRVSGREGRVT